MMHRFYIFFVCFCVLVSCGEDKSAKKEGRKALEQSSEKSEMRKRYDAAIKSINPEKVAYTSLTNLSVLEKKMKETSGDEQIKTMVEYATTLLNNGKTDASIAKLKFIINLLKDNPSVAAKQFSYTMKKQLAIAYMRKAEQENCIANHNDESCIIPISKKAQHVKEEGSRKTIKVLTELLQENPSDKELHYILNIAYMTLGEYPNKVPKKYRIPESYFKQNSSIPRFKDIAANVRVAENKLSGGTCIDDFNNDGYLDIIASSWGFYDQIKYFENDTQGSFVDMTSKSQLTGTYGGLNLRHADYNNDGHLDFMILRGAWLDTEGKIPNSLMRNNGDGTFTDVTIEAGVFSLRPTQTAVWGDFNLDGWIDIFIANESSPNGLNPVELFINNGDGTFTDRINEAGISDNGYYKGVAIGDINNDRLPDLYLSNFFGANSLWVNTSTNGKLSFKKASSSLGLAAPKNSFSTWIFDYNNDGYEDIFVSGYSDDKNSPAALMMKYSKEKFNQNRPHLYKNNGNGTFKEVSLQVGLDEPATTMGCNFGDLDNDGYLDFYLSTGNPNFYSIVPNKMYHNIGGNKFQDITYSSGFGHIQKGHAVGFGDLDMDGDQDIYTVMGGAYNGDIFSNLLFENPIGNENNWISIKLVGKASNKAAIGAKIIVSIDENGKKRKIYHNVGYDASFGGNSLIAELGIGKAERIDEIKILWPNQQKTSTVLTGVAANQIIKIQEEKEGFEALKINPISFNK